MDRITTASETEWRYYPPEDVNSKMLLLTTGKVLISGIWGAGHGLIAWAPLPKRNKELEKQMGF